MKCRYCNRELPDSSKFCPFCGQVIDAGPEVQEPDVFPAEPIYPEPAAFAAEPEVDDYTVRLDPAAADDYTVRLDPGEAIPAEEDYTVRLSPGVQIPADEDYTVRLDPGAQEPLNASNTAWQGYGVPDQDDLDYTVRLDPGGQEPLNTGDTAWQGYGVPDQDDLDYTVRLDPGVQEPLNTGDAAWQGYGVPDQDDFDYTVRLDQDAALPGEEETIYLPPEAETAPGTDYGMNVPPAVTPAHEKKKRKALPVILGVLIGVILLGAAAMYLLPKGGKPEATPTPAVTDAGDVTISTNTPAPEISAPPETPTPEPTDNNTETEGETELDPKAIIQQFEDMTLDMDEGTTLQLDSGGAAIEWLSTDNAIVRVDERGIVTAVGPGNAMIAAILGDEQASIPVIVRYAYSEWMEALPEEITEDEYDIDTALYYHFRTRETTTSTESKLSGWTMVRKETLSSDYGSWSNWTTDKITANDKREVQEQKQYSYRTLVSQGGLGDWGSWGSWTANRQKTDANTEEESRTSYRYHYYTCSSCGALSPTTKCACGATISSNPKVLWSDQKYSSVSKYSWAGNQYSGTQYYYTTIGGTKYFFDENNSANIRTEYRYRSRTEKAPQWSDWSSWQTSKPAASSSTEVKERTVYRSRDVVQKFRYHYERYGDWSELEPYVEGETDIADTEELQYEIVTRYRYRQK